MFNSWNLSCFYLPHNPPQWLFYLSLTDDLILVATVTFSGNPSHLTPQGCLPTSLRHILTIIHPSGVSRLCTFQRKSFPSSGSWEITSRPLQSPAWSECFVYLRPLQMVMLIMYLCGDLGPSSISLTSGGTIPRNSPLSGCPGLWLTTKAQRSSPGGRYSMCVGTMLQVELGTVCTTPLGEVNGRLCLVFPELCPVFLCWL